MTIADNKPPNAPRGRQRPTAMSELSYGWRRHAVRIVIGAALVAAAYETLSVHATYQRQWRIVRRFATQLGGTVALRYEGPKWISRSLYGRLPPFFERIHRVGLNQTTITDDEIADLSSLASLENLNVCSTRFSDADLMKLKNLRNLNWIDVRETKVTAAGRDQFQAALPNCMVVADP